MIYITHKLLCQLFTDDTSLFYMNMPVAKRIISIHKSVQILLQRFEKFLLAERNPNYRHKIWQLNVAKRIWDNHRYAVIKNIYGLVSLIPSPKPRNKAIDSEKHSSSYWFNKHHSYFTNNGTGTNTQHFTQFATKGIKSYRLETKKRKKLTWGNPSQENNLDLHRWTF
jgi:hypothetical protein